MTNLVVAELFNEVKRNVEQYGYSVSKLELRTNSKEFKTLTLLVKDKYDFVLTKLYLTDDEMYISSIVELQNRFHTIDLVSKLINKSIKSISDR